MKTLFRWYGFKHNEPVKLTEHLENEEKRKLSRLFQEQYPDKIAVVREYPNFILFRGTWRGLHEYSYNFCIEKASIFTGEIVVKRLSTGEKLKTLELRKDHERNHGKEKK